MPTDRDAPNADARIAELDRLIDTNPDAALRELSTLAAWWQDVGRVGDGRALTERALERSRGRSTVHRVEALLAASELAFRQGDQDVVVRRSREAIDLALAIRNPALAAIAHVELARVAYREGDAPGLEAHAQEALRLAGHDPGARRGALHMLAWAAHTASDRALARLRFEASLAFRRQSGDPLSIAVEIANLGDLAAEDGDLVEAAERLGEALELMRDLDNRYFVVNTLPSVAAVAGLAGLDETSARLIGAGEALADASGLVPDPSDWRPVFDDVAARLGDRFGTLSTAGTELDAMASVTLAIETTREIARTASSGGQS